MERTYVAIDLKSFYASVECVERGLDPLSVNLVVADASRTEKTICLAVSPSLKSFHIPGRARLFEVVQRVKEVNAERKQKAPNQTFTGKSFVAQELETHPELELDYIVAPPRMQRYMEVSSQIYSVYLRYVAPEDMHVYSVDEVFLDVTEYLNTYRMTARQLAMVMISEVLAETGITATAGIGSNLYLCKIAMDIMAKHTKPDENGVRIAELDELTYRQKLWNHRPLTDFWRVGGGIQKKLNRYGMFTMGDVARCSIGKVNDLQNEDLLYRLFGVNAELLIDHAWGYEPCTIADIKAYKPSTNSLSSGQVLSHPYPFEKGRLIVREMTELLCLELVEKGLWTDQIALTVIYDVENMKNTAALELTEENLTEDRYHRRMPKPVHKGKNLVGYTCAGREITDAMIELYDSEVNPLFTVRKLVVAANRLLTESEVRERGTYEQLTLDFLTEQTNPPEAKHLQHEKDKESENEKRLRNIEKEKKLMEAIVAAQKKYGKNIILKGMNLQEGATTIERNGQIGGHKA